MQGASTKLLSLCCSLKNHAHAARPALWAYGFQANAGMTIDIKKGRQRRFRLRNVGAVSVFFHFIKHYVAHHDGNIGIVCGKKSNLLGIDADMPDGSASMESLESLLKLPDTLSQTNGEGRKQFFFLYPKQSGN